jgi:ribosomal-protein-alanine N-acetyltransferase
MIWTIRRMAISDIEAVLELEQQISKAPHWSFSDYERCTTVDNSAPLKRMGFIAGTEGRLAGFSVGKLVAGVCELETVAVIPEARGRGIGRALLDAVADWAQAEGAARIELEVRASNNRAIKLYEQAGFQRESLRAAYYQAPEEDAVLMGKVLIPSGKLP